MSSILLLPLNKTKKSRLLLLTKNMNDNSNNTPFPLMSNPLVVYATEALPSKPTPFSWIELGLRVQVVFFTIDLNGQEVMIILQNPNFLSQLVSEGMKLVMENYLNHLWINNIMNPLAPTVAPMLHHNMQQHWGLPTHFNPLLNPMTNPKPLFLRSSGTYPKQPSVLSLDTTTSSRNDSSSNPNSIRNPQVNLERVSTTDSFTEISNLKEVALMLFPVYVVVQVLKWLFFKSRVSCPQRLMIRTTRFSNTN
ncbi:hypothetical protein KY284_007739 [Solanum tuberosum]|nr:hypothetical protein KY284_007739 [Solanum tuberosum]